jgi:hypothetical protein
MNEPPAPQIVELLAWIAERPRRYAETMEAWRSTCPRHTAWEDALLAGYVQVLDGGPMPEAAVRLTARGVALLDKEATHGSVPG